jgi:protein-S-isoprenylcysteine O-methyltransferase Ste14
LVVGELVDLTIISFAILPKNLASALGAVLITLATGLIIWTHYCGKTYSRNRKSAKISAPDLLHGPYRFSRNPHHIGIGALLIGLAVFVNSIALIGSTVVAFLIVNVYFVAREEKIMKERHGDSYDEYKTKTHKWL